MESASTLMQDRGYSAIGVAEICERADVRKGSFYYFFESKQALTVATVRARWTGERTRWVETLGEGVGLDGIEALVRDYVATQREQRHSSGSIVGCLYANLAVEVTSAEEDLRECLREIFEDQQSLMLEALKRASAEGALAPDRATPDDARAVVAQLEGTIMLARLYNDPSLLNSLWRQIAGLLGVR